MAVLGPNVCVNMNGHNNIHSQLSKSLERVLEDAYLSGELKLSGRKLREFPKPVKYDLSDTVIADLSKNRFSELPEEVTTYIYLEKLLVSQNIIRSIPETVGGLQSLTYLDLSCNQLTELPREVCSMPLQVLLLPDNMLASLPKEIGRMTTLAELDASNNRLTQVPMTLGDCSGLRCLNLSNNQLGLLPLQITYLKLEHLDVSCNCISSLPLELRNMATIITLNLDNNPLVSPPTTICMRGRVHIFKYLENMSNKESQPKRDDTRRSKHSSFNTPATHQITSGNATIDCLRHKPRHVVDSGYCTDGVDKRWSNDGGDGCGSGRSTPSTPSTLSPGAAMSRHSTSNEPLTPLTPVLTGQYKEALRQQRQQDVYRPRTDQPSPDVDSPQSQNQSPVHLQRSPHSPVNGFYSRSLSNSSTTSPVPTNPNSPLLTNPNSPLLHSTPRRFQSNGVEKEEPKRPVQKVVPSRNVNKMYNGNVDYSRVNGTDTYSKPTSPTKSPTNTLGYLPKQNGEARLLTTVSYLKGAGPKPGKMPWNKEAAPDKLSFTMKREFDKQKEESDLLQQLRTIIEGRLKMCLPRELAPALADGVVLCHLANHVRPRAVASVHVPSPAQPKLTMARCRRNVDNFLEACRKIGVEEEDICTAEDITERAYLGPLARTLAALLAHATPRSPKDIRDPNAPEREPNDSDSNDSNEVNFNVEYSTEESYEREYSTDSNESYQNQEFIEMQSYAVDSIEVNYDRRHDNKYVSNFNFAHKNYTIDETDELNYENNNVEPVQYSPVYANEYKKGPYYYNNRIQFVTPYFTKSGVLMSDNLEIYDTDEVDCPLNLTEDENLERYDRGKMNLDIQNSHNNNVRVETPSEREHRIFFTVLCIGGFILSTIILIIYPL
ncbi:leucine-rich repeat and calponin homology domain-containing protein isoform X2 [Aricia agestis]|uniref:leucine-rich repeat and calponin homology domain-containing protein isoform X2 n=1 Tax=Aricia agestis TaxID=91739 RepID=UPI001C203CC9|nr:leucine-rich repeat and calponin homology domain-containing protein isoform X2 [Aricia agestis]